MAHRTLSSGGSLAPGWLGPDVDDERPTSPGLTHPRPHPSILRHPSATGMRVSASARTIPRLHAQIARTQLERLITLGM